MKKQNNSPLHNMRLVVYAIVAFISLLVIALISISTQNKSLTLNSSASGPCPAEEPKYNISTKCDSGTHSKVQFKCAAGERLHTLSALAVSRGPRTTGQSCLPPAGFTEAINKVCKCNANQPRNPRSPTPTSEPGQKCAGNLDCVTGAKQCKGQLVCNAVSHCCSLKPRSAPPTEPTPTPGVRLPREPESFEVAPSYCVSNRRCEYDEDCYSYGKRGMREYSCNNNIQDTLHFRTCCKPLRSP